MHLPLRSWKNTLASLGLKLRDSKERRDGRAARQRQTRRLQLESLERREMLAADLLSPVADAFTRSGIYADDNFGSETYIAAKYQSGQGNSERESYLRFDASQIDGQAEITQATLRLHVDIVGVASIQNSIATVADDTWNESTVDWNGKPTRGATLDSVTITETGWVEFDVTDYVANRSDDLLSINLFSQSDQGG